MTSTKRPSTTKVKQSPNSAKKSSTGTPKRAKGGSSSLQQNQHSSLKNNFEGGKSSGSSSSSKPANVDSDMDVVFLKERRAVSENRFKLLEQLKEKNKENLGHNFGRTRSDHDINRTRLVKKVMTTTKDEPDWKAGGGFVTTVNISSLKEKFEVTSGGAAVGHRPTSQLELRRQQSPSEGVLKEVVGASTTNSSSHANSVRGCLGNAPPGNYPKQRRSASGSGGGGSPVAAAASSQQQQQGAPTFWPFRPNLLR